MGQTDSDYRDFLWWDEQHTRYTSQLCCPTCGAVLCGEWEAQEYDTDTVIGCDDCGVTVTVETAERHWVSDEGHHV